MTKIRILNLLLLIAVIELLVSYPGSFNEIETMLYYGFWWFLIGLVGLAFYISMFGKRKNDE